VAHEAAHRAYEQHLAQQRAAAQAQEEERRAAAAARQQQKEAEAAADKKRDQTYQDQLRALDVQQRSLAVEAEKARVSRSNEYIDQELKAKAAETDVVKSQADSNRNLSEGAKTLLEKTGDAEVKSQSGWFK
jgi:sulfur carrier protein ThiS